MQFVPSSYFLQQQSQQQQQQQTSQSPTSTSAQAEQQQQSTQPQGVALPPTLPAATFTQVAGLQAPPGVELNAQGKAKRKQVKNACGKLSL